MTLSEKAYRLFLGMGATTCAAEIAKELGLVTA
jgi:hypothetical protein